MKQKTKFMFLTAVSMVSIVLVCTAPGQSKSKPQSAGASSARLRPLELGRKIPLNTESHPVQWKTNTYHLVKLGSVQFELDKDSSHLQAEIQASTTSFDNVDYDISTAVFDASGALLGTARTDCNVQRIWLGALLMSQPKLALDFGNSLDYGSASSFMISISRHKVLTPDQWQTQK